LHGGSPNSFDFVPKNSENFAAVSEGGAAEPTLSFFRIDDTDLHILRGFAALLAIQVLQYRFSFC